ncbi:hypothetical protein PGT21_016694 [Puccinia graminis f. sp. tritici]|uniref:Uncharacterized protein n=1 Tax=Puccinia graminis f. sp. tritici TaxID=56615 RepID=A0A5B0LMU6_PUCGR|nr:hypothetical protein PGT21_016694 [Puccinia graminis f. sp. tritici]
MRCAGAEFISCLLVYCTGLRTTHELQSRFRIDTELRSHLTSRFRNASSILLGTPYSTSISLGTPYSITFSFVGPNRWFFFSLVVWILNSVEFALVDLATCFNARSSVLTLDRALERSTECFNAQSSVLTLDRALERSTECFNARPSVRTLGRALERAIDRLNDQSLAGGSLQPPGMSRGLREKL